jgi:chitinase
MIWAMDQMNQMQSNGLGQAPGVTVAQQADAEQMSANQAAKLSCYTTDCNEKCKSGTNEVAEVFGQPGQVSTRDRCSKGQYRSVCCNDGTTMGTCSWRGYRGMGMSCIQGCASDETEVITDTSVSDGGKEKTCNGGLQSVIYVSLLFLFLFSPIAFLCDRSACYLACILLAKPLVIVLLLRFQGTTIQK